jgi:hypothetical protein
MLDGAKGVPLIVANGDETTVAGDLESVEVVMSHCHELCEAWIAKNGVVGQCKVGDVEIKAFNVVVVVGSKGDEMAHLPDRRGRAFSHPEERPGWHQAVLRHLHFLKNLDGDDVEARPSIDESTVDDDVIDRWCAHDGNGAHGASQVRVVFFIEVDLVGGPLQPRRVGAWLRRHSFSRQLLEVAV